MHDPTAGYIPANCERCGDERDIDLIRGGLCLQCEREQNDAIEADRQEADDDL